MSHNLEYLLSRPGALKIATVIFGIVATILSTHSYGESPYTDFYADEVRLRNNSNRLPGTELELYNLSTTMVFLGCSVLYLIAHALFDMITQSRLNKFVDTAFHMAGALLLFAGGTTLIYNAVSIENNGCPSFQLVAQGPTPKTRVSFIPTLANPIRKERIFNLNPSDPTFCHEFGEKVIAAAFNIANAILYGLLGFVIFSTDLELL